MQSVLTEKEKISLFRELMKIEMRNDRGQYINPVTKKPETKEEITQRVLKMIEEAINNEV